MPVRTPLVALLALLSSLGVFACRTAAEGRGPGAGRGYLAAEAGAGRVHVVARPTEMLAPPPGAAFALLAQAGPGVPPPADPLFRAPTDWSADLTRPAGARMREAVAAKTEVVRALFRAADVPFPPAQVLFRVYKREKELEVWASGTPRGPLAKIASYGICAASGGLGPKRREGDLQVPEGFYTIAYFWPDSSFYLAANVGYPNALDQALGGPRPGSDIMIHGGCASIGCLAMTDERMQELWVIGTAAQARGRVPVHLYPAKDLDGLIDDPAHAEHHAFWRDLREVHEAFEAHRTLPDVRIVRGRYRLAR